MLLLALSAPSSLSRVRFTREKQYVMDAIKWSFGLQIMILGEKFHSLVIVRWFFISCLIYMTQGQSWTLLSEDAGII